MELTGTDPNVAATTQETGTAALADDPSGAVEAGQETAQAQPLDDDFLKRLETMDPATLPVNLRQKIEAPFKADHTKKTQELSETQKRFETEKAAMFELARRAISDRQQAPAGPDARDVKRAQLLELASSGDQKSLAELIEMAAEDKVAPVRTQVTLQNAYESAVRATPAVKEHWNEIYQVLSTDPVIGAMAAANNYQGASKVMMALGMERELMNLRPAYETTRKELEALKEKISIYERERTAGLPSSTSKAGTTAGRPAMPESNDIEQIGLQAWLASGGIADTYR